MNLAVIRASIFLRSTRVGQLLTKLGTQKQEWRGMEMFLDKQVPASSPLMPYAYSNFEQNLHDTIKVAQGAGANVIVSTVATNVKDCAPFASQHRQGLNQANLSAWSALVNQGAEFEREQDWGQALNAYLAALRIDDQYAELEFRIARTLMKKGDYAGAQPHFERARDLDTLRFRADSRINAINRSVASSMAGTKLVDADAMFAQQSPNGVTGSELVYEHVHMTPEGNYLLARSMFDLIARQITGQPVAASEIPSKADCDRLLAFTPHDRQRIAGEMLDRLQKPPFTNQLNHADQVLRLMSDAGGPVESPDQTVAEYQWAIAQKPDDRVLHYNFGLFLFNFDREAGAEQLKLAQPWDGFPVFAPDGTLIQ
jgi:tetratricopeptide (TPR) repeat protein